MLLPVSENLHKVLSPLEEARTALTLSQVPAEHRDVSDVISELTSLAESLKKRWDVFCQYRIWAESSVLRGTPPPQYWDETRGEMRSGEYALAPGHLINTALSQTVELTLREFSAYQVGAILKRFKNTPDCSVLKNVAINAEGAMEQEALTLIFKIADRYPDQYTDMVSEMAMAKSINPTVLEVLEALVVDLPRALKEQCPMSYRELPFKYFDNYKELVLSELQLLSLPFILHNSASSSYYNTMDELLNVNPILRSVLQHVDMSPEAGQIVANYPELFGCKYLEDMIFTFVGAGFPLTGIILHITTGASVTLIDYDEKAVRNANKFLSMTEKLGITRPGAIKTVHANAIDVIYVSNSALPAGQKRYDGVTCPPHCPFNPELSGKTIVPTDILDLASSLPASITSQVIKVNAALVPLIRKRNVCGTSEVLYERFELKDDTTFRLVGEVTPPQKVISNSTPGNRVVALTSTININSCQLLVNTCNYESKYKSLQQLLAVFSKKNKEVGSPVLDDRIRRFFEKSYDSNLIIKNE